MNMTLGQLERLTDAAIDRWADDDLPRLPGKPSLKVELVEPTLVLLDNMAGRALGKTNYGTCIVLFDAQKVKAGILEFRSKVSGDRHDQS